MFADERLMISHPSANGNMGFVLCLLLGQWDLDKHSRVEKQQDHLYEILET